MMRTKTSGWDGLVHVDDTIRYKNESGRRRERLTFLSPTKQNPIILQTEIHVDEVGADPASTPNPSQKETYSHS
jgi:hypothetical protein